MFIGACKIKLHAPWSGSLKDKRMAIRSITDKCRHKFNITMAEVADNELHRMITLGFAVVSNSRGHAEESLDHILSFIEEYSDCEIISEERDYFVIE